MVAHRISVGINNPLSTVSARPYGSRSSGTLLICGYSSYSLETFCRSARSRRSATGLGARSFTGPHKSFVVEVPVHKQASEVVEREEVENETFVVRRAEHSWEYRGAVARMLALKIGDVHKNFGIE